MEVCTLTFKGEGISELRSPILITLIQTVPAGFDFTISCLDLGKGVQSYCPLLSRAGKMWSRKASISPVANS